MTDHYCKIDYKCASGPTKSGKADSQIKIFRDKQVTVINMGAYWTWQGVYHVFTRV